MRRGLKSKLTMSRTILFFLDLMRLPCVFSFMPTFLFLIIFIFKVFIIVIIIIVFIVLAIVLAIFLLLLSS